MLYQSVRDRLAVQQPFVLCTVLSDSRLGEKFVITSTGEIEGELPSEQLWERLRRDATTLLSEEKSAIVAYDTAGGTLEVFLDVFPVPARLVIVGGGQTAEALSRLAQIAGYAVTVCDARGAFLQASRYPGAETLKGWPQDVLPSLRLDVRSFVVLLSHDPKFDEPALDVALRSPAPYIGAIGSRRTQRERRGRLLQAGFTEEDLTRLYGPVGLNIGGKSVEETALAILAEVTAVRYARPAGFLRDRPS